MDRDQVGCDGGQPVRRRRWHSVSCRRTASSGLLKRRTARRSRHGDLAAADLTPDYCQYVTAGARFVRISWVLAFFRRCDTGGVTQPSGHQPGMGVRLASALLSLSGIHGFVPWRQPAALTLHSSGLVGNPQTTGLFQHWSANCTEYGIVIRQQPAEPFSMKPVAGISWGGAGALVAMTNGCSALIWGWAKY